MPKVLERVGYTGRIVGGPFDQHMVCISACREGRKYVPEVTVKQPNGSYLPVNAMEIPSAFLRITKDTPRAALDEAFKSFYFYLNNETAAVRMMDLQQEDRWWVMLDETGKRDWPTMEKMSDQERADFQNEEFPYDPPNSEALIDAGRMTLGSSSPIRFNAGDITPDNKLKQAKGTEETPEQPMTGGPSPVDGNVAADNGLSDFLSSDSGLTPEKSSSQAVGSEQ